ncbi:AAA family ATPase, partial [Myxococcota bacterium]|nr:AAA family ATPase [Myxococcota bacterium]
EIEKAHPDVFNILLQVLEDGRLTDGHGRTVDFRNTVLIMTSNVGSDILQDLDMDDDARSELLMQALRAQFRPEFLNRVDDVVSFSTLGKEHLSAILDIQLKYLRTLLWERKLRLQVDSEARTYLIDAGYDPVFGARPLKRVIVRELQNPLAESILAGEFVAGDTILAGVEDEKISFVKA